MRFEPTKASGPGGQHVNKTESAVRATHLPTGLSCVAREERCQHRNKELALARLAQTIAGRGAQAEADARRDAWTRHDALERGNAVRVYTGPEFRLWQLLPTAVFHVIPPDTFAQSLSPVARASVPVPLPRTPGPDVPRMDHLWPKADGQPLRNEAKK